MTNPIPRDPPPPTGIPVARPRIVLAGALLSMILAALDQNIVNTALPRIVGDLGGLAHMSWLITAFMLTATTTLYGAPVRHSWHRPLFFCAISLFVSGSLLCGLAQSMTQLIALRVLQDLGAGGLLVLVQSAIGDVFSPRERPKYQGLITGAFALASVAGPLIGGGITSMASWHWVFFVNLPVGGLAFALIAIGLKEQKRGEPKPIDYAGVILLGATTTALLLWLAWGGGEFPWTSGTSAGFVAAIVVMFLLFVRHERHAPEPLVRLGLLSNVTYTRGLAVGGMMTFIWSLGGALGVAASGTIMMQHLAAAMSTGHWNAGAIDALSRLSTSQQEIIVEVYHQALMWCFGYRRGLSSGADVVLRFKRRGDDGGIRPAVRNAQPRLARPHRRPRRLSSGYSGHPVAIKVRAIRAVRVRVASARAAAASSAARPDSGARDTARQTAQHPRGFHRRGIAGNRVETFETHRQPVLRRPPAARGNGAA